MTGLPGPIVLLAVGVVLAFLALDMWASRVAVPTDRTHSHRLARTALAYGASMMVLASALDPWGALSGNGNLRFLIVALVWAVSYLFGRSAQRQRGRHLVTNRLLLAFVGYLFVGAVVGRFVLGTQASVLSVAVVMLVAIVPVGAGAIPSLSVSHALVSSLIVFVIAEVFLFAYSGHPAWVSPTSYGHGLGALLIGAVVGCWLLRWRIVVVPVVGLAGYVFLAYPAATYVIVAGAAVGTVCMTSRSRFRSQAAIALAVAAGAAMAIFIFDPSAVTGITGQYYQAVGKVNNDNVRVSLDNEALSRLKEHPFFGSFFTGESTVNVPNGIQIVVRGRAIDQLPPHNDILQVGMLGGIVGLVLLLGWLTALNITVIRWCRRQAQDARTLMRILLVLVNGFVATSVVEPVLTVSSSALILATSVTALRVCLSQPLPESEEASEMAGVEAATPRLGSYPGAKRR